MRYKLFIFAFVFVLLLVGTVGAMEIDNVKDVQETYGTAGYKDIVIVNAFGLGSTLWSGTLNYNTESCSRFCSSTQTITLPEDGVLITDVIFETILPDESRVEQPIRDFKLYIKTGTKPIIVDDYKEQCKLEINGSTTCSMIISGNHIARYEIIWTEYELGAELPAGTYETKLEGDKKPNRSVEWIYTYGSGIGEIKLDEWAAWAAGAAIFNNALIYWDFNSIQNNQIEELTEGIYNLTRAGLTTPTLIDGLLGESTQTDTGKNWSVRGQVAVPAKYHLGGSNWSINFWLNQTAWAANGRLFAADEAGDKVFCQMLADKMRFDWDGVGALGDVIFFPPKEDWRMVTFIGNDTNGTVREVYVDGVFNVSLSNHNANLSLDDLFESADGFNIPGAAPGASFDGAIDEFGIWNISLTAAQVSELYNSGLGLAFGAGSSVTLNKPTDNFETVTNNVTFNCSAEVIGANLVNMSLYHNESGTFEFNQTKVLTGTINSTNFTSNFSIGKYKWNCLACDDDSDCGWGAANFTFSRNPLTVDGEFWHNATIEGASETFYINVTTSTGFQVSTGTLRYNNTNYAGMFERTGNSYEFERAITVDSLVADANLTFNWTFVMEDLSTQISDDHNQSVVALAIDDCETNSILIMNLTVFDENSQVKFNASLFNSTMEIDIDVFSRGTSSEVLNFSRNFTKNESVSICINVDLSQTSYDMDAQIRYDADLYAPEFHNLQNFSLSNTTAGQNISLYDLLDANAQAFKITFKDENFIAVADAIIQIQRKYIDEGVFKTVEQPITDYKGETLAQLQVNEAIYTFIVSKNGETLGTFDELIAICQNPTLDACVINLNSFGTSIQPGDFTTGDDFVFTLTHNKTTRTVKSIFSVPSGATATVLLNATLYDNIGVTSACSDKLISSAGTLTCTVPIALGNGTFVIKIVKDGVEVGSAGIDLRRDPGDLYGANLVFLSLFLMLTLIGVGISDDPKITGVFLLIGAILLVALNLVSTGTGGRFYGPGATILWIFIAIIIVLIKGSKRT